MTKHLTFKQFAAVFNETTREVDLFGMTEGGTLYRQRDNREEGWEAISTHRYEQPKAEKPVSKSMQRDRNED